MLALFSEMSSKVPVADVEAGAPLHDIKRLSSLRHVREEDIHIVPSFSALMDEIVAFPELLPFSDKDSGPIPCLYVGSMNATKNLEALLAHNCRYVLSVLHEAEFPDSDFPSPRHLHRFEGIVYKRINAQDDIDVDISVAFEEARDFLLTAFRSGSSCLVHCRAGISRSVAIAISFLIYYKRW